MLAEVFVVFVGGIVLLTKFTEQRRDDGSRCQPIVDAWFWPRNGYPGFAGWDLSSLTGESVKGYVLDLVQCEGSVFPVEVLDYRLQLYLRNIILAVIVPTQVCQLPFKDLVVYPQLLQLPLPLLTLELPQDYLVVVDLLFQVTSFPLIVFLVRVDLLIEVLLFPTQLQAVIFVHPNRLVKSAPQPV